MKVAQVWRVMVLALGLALPGLGRAQAPASAPAESPAVVVGVYVPSVAFGDSMARARFAEALAANLSQAIGRPVRGKAFAGAGEFFTQVQANEVDFAVVDAAVALERGGFTPLAQAQSSGNPARALVLVAQSPGTVASFAGKSVVLPEGVGREDRFLANFVLQGQLGAEHFVRQKTVRDAQAALSLVKLGKADLTVTWDAQASGLAVVLSSRPAPLPVFVRARAGVPADVQAAVAKAAPGLSVGAGPFEGFGPWNPNGSALSALRSALGAAPGAARVEPVFAPSTGALPTPEVFLGASLSPGAAPLPPAADLILVPAPPSDPL